jgi:2-polyprenyl-3-methyl-5-hydroxy-6-metoxy-1,4-benzoquinol methylase
MPNEETLSHWYKNSYRQVYKKSERPSQRHVLRAARLAIERYEWFRQGLPDARVSTALDLGASGGEFVHLMSTLGVDAMGVEPHAGYAQQASSGLGLNVLLGTLRENLPLLRTRRFDLITMFHVLEHMVDPVGTLRTVGSLMAEDGHLYIEVPNVAAPCSPSNAFFRAHTLYFTVHSIRQVANEAGFEVHSGSSGAASNLSVVLRRASNPTRTKWSFDDGLLSAQAKRRWLPYILESVVAGRAHKKVAVRIEERLTASKFSTESELLSTIHGAYRRWRRIER